MFLFFVFLFFTFYISVTFKQIIVVCYLQDEKSTINDPKIPATQITSGDNVSEKECTNEPKETPKNKDANDKRPQVDSTATSVMVFFDNTY